MERNDYLAFHPTLGFSKSSQAWPFRFSEVPPVLTFSHEPFTQQNNVASIKLKQRFLCFIVKSNLDYGWR